MMFPNCIRHSVLFALHEYCFRKIQAVFTLLLCFPLGNVNVSMGVQSMTGTPPVTGYPGSANQSVGPSMPLTSQSVLPGQQGFMPGMHPSQTLPMSQHPQSQQFMIQQNVPMGTYNRPPVQQVSSNRFSFSLF